MGAAILQGSRNLVGSALDRPPVQDAMPLSEAMLSDGTPMSEMVERVARAIWELSTTRPRSFDLLHPVKQDDVRAQAALRSRRCASRSGPT
jgi:hypothetical protein